MLGCQCLQMLFDEPSILTLGAPAQCRFIERGLVLKVAIYHDSSVLPRELGGESLALRGDTFFGMGEVCLASVYRHV